MIKMLNRRTKDRQGSALVFVILIFSIVSILTLSIHTVTNLYVKSSVRYKNKNQAHYLARAGAEAIKYAWLVEGTKQEGVLETIFVNENYEFKLESELKPNEKVLATIDVSIERIKEIDEVEDNIGLGSWRIVSKAEIDGVKGEAVLTSTGNTSIEELNEQYDDENRIIKIKKNNGIVTEGEILKGKRYNLSHDEKGNYHYNHITRHKEIRGTLIVDLEPDKDEGEEDRAYIRFNQEEHGNENNADRHIAIIGQNIFFKNPLDLRLKGSFTLRFPFYNERRGALIVTAETIVFEDDIHVNQNDLEINLWPLGSLTLFRDYGILVLDLPEGLGFSKYEIIDNVEESYREIIRNDSEDARYGRVYFLGNVIGEDGSHDNVKELSKKGFYFRKSDEPVIIGYKDDGKEDKYDPLKQLIPMKDINPVPTPETSPVFFWN